MVSLVGVTNRGGDSGLPEQKKIAPREIVIGIAEWKRQLGDRFEEPDFPRKIKGVETEAYVILEEFINSPDPKNPTKLNGETHQLMLTPIYIEEFQKRKDTSLKWVLVPRWLPA